MRTQARLRTPPGHSTHRLQNTRSTEHAHAHSSRSHHGRQTVQHHADIVEDVGSEAVAFALGFDGCADPVGEQDRSHARGCVLEGV